MAEFEVSPEMGQAYIQATAVLVHELISLIMATAPSASIALWAVHVVRLTLEEELRRQTNSAPGTLALIDAMPGAAQELFDHIRAMPSPTPLHFAKPAGNA